MVGDIYHFSLPTPLLRRQFWLYIWRIGLPNGETVHYVGMTGDTGAARAQAAINRVGAHLEHNVRSNALRRYLKLKRDVDLEDCQSLDFIAFGPVYPKPSLTDYPRERRNVAALEKFLWARMEAAGYVMLNNQPQAIAELDQKRWDEVSAAFRRHFPHLE
jgi:hypothetical protein